MFRQWFLMGRMAVLAAASLLLAASAGSAQQGYFKQLESQGWSSGGSSGRSYGRSYYRPRRYEENFTPGDSYNGRSFVSPSFQENHISGVDQRVRIHLEVPASARVSFDNEKTNQTGSSRDFITPPLPSGKEYSYAVRVEWTENGHKMESTRRISIHAGDRASLDMSKPTLARKTPE